MTNKSIVEIYRLDESVTGNVSTSKYQYFAIDHSDQGSTLADDPYLKKWLMGNGLDESMAVSAVNVAAANWVVEFDLDNLSFAVNAYLCPRLAVS